MSKILIDLSWGQSSNVQACKSPVTEWPIIQLPNMQTLQYRYCFNGPWAQFPDLTDPCPSAGLTVGETVLAGMELKNKLIFLF